MSLIKNIYDSAPIWLQNLMITVAGYRNNKIRYGDMYHKHKAFLKKFDTWNIEEKLEYQRDSLVQFINYAYVNSKFYSELYKDIDITKIQSISDLNKLPIVDKEMLRSRAEDVFTIPTKGAVPLCHTSCLIF